MDELFFFKYVNLSSFHIFIFIKKFKNLGQHASGPAHASSAACAGSLTGACSAKWKNLCAAHYVEVFEIIS